MRLVLILFVSMSCLSSCATKAVSLADFCPEFNGIASECSRKNGGNLGKRDVYKKLTNKVLTHKNFTYEDNSIDFIFVFRDDGKIDAVRRLHGPLTLAKINDVNVQFMLQTDYTGDYRVSSDGSISFELMNKECQETYNGTVTFFTFKDDNEISWIGLNGAVLTDILTYEKAIFQGALVTGNDNLTSNLDRKKRELRKYNEKFFAIIFGCFDDKVKFRETSDEDFQDLTSPRVQAPYLSAGSSERQRRE